MGKVFVSGSKITWCKGKTRRENGIDLKWRDVIAVIEMLGIQSKRNSGEGGNPPAPGTPDEFEKFSLEVFNKTLRRKRKRHKRACPDFYPNDTDTTQSEAEGVETPGDATAP